MYASLGPLACDNSVIHNEHRKLKGFVVELEGHHSFCCHKSCCHHRIEVCSTNWSKREDEEGQ